MKIYFLFITKATWHNLYTTWHTSQLNLFRWKRLLVKQHALQEKQSEWKESKEIKRWVKEIKLSRRVSGVIYVLPWKCRGHFHVALDRWFEWMLIQSHMRGHLSPVLDGLNPKSWTKTIILCTICSLFPVCSILHVFMCCKSMSVHLFLWLSH